MVGDDCPCPDCDCPGDGMVCKNGHCKSSYLIMFTASWCGPCKRMYPVITDLRDKGYIVYLLDVDKYANDASKFGATSYPTFVAMEGGKEQKRWTGITSQSEFEAVLKTKDEQKKPDPEPVKPTDYKLW